MVQTQQRINGIVQKVARKHGRWRFTYEGFRC